MDNHHQENRNNDHLSIKKLREQIALTIGKDLANEGFSIDKNLLKAQKKIQKKNKIKILFDCYDYKPTKLEFRLLLVFTIFEIDEEAKKFYAFCNEDYTSGTTFVLGEGDFHPKVRSLDKKLRTSATHIVTNSSTLNEGLEDCRTVLRNEIIPLLPKFSILEEFQDFVSKNHTEIIRLNLVIPSIIAAMLKGQPELKNLIDFLWRELELESKSELHKLKKMAGSALSYANNNFHLS